MTLKKQIIKNDNFDITYYPFDRFSSMDIFLNFEMECSKENYFYLLLLTDYMFSTTKKYKDPNLYIRRTKELYNIGVYPIINTIGDKILVTVRINFINPKLLGEENFFEEAVAFSKEVLFKPNFTNKLPDYKLFNRKLKELKEGYKDDLTNPDYKAVYYFNKYIGKECHRIDHLVGSKNELNNIFKGSYKKIYSMYQKLMNSFISMQILGDFSDKEINILKEEFKFNKVNKINDDYFVPYNFKKYNKKTVDKNAEHSVYFELYAVKNYDINNRYLYRTIMYFLNNQVGRILHTKLRDELGLVYSASAGFSGEYGFLMVISNIDRKNKEKCHNGIEDALNILKDEKLVEDLLEKAVKRAEEVEFLIDEDYFEYLEYVRRKSLKLNLTHDEFTEKLKGITPKDIIDAVNDLERRSTYIYEGTKNKENV